MFYHLWIEKLKAALSNREYQIITECTLSNVSETPNIVPPPNYDSGKSPIDTGEPFSHQDKVLLILKPKTGNMDFHEGFC